MNLSNDNGKISFRSTTCVLIALVFGVLITLSGCGQKGSLYLPNKAKATYAGQPQNDDR